MKRVFAIIIAAALIFSLAACGSKSEPTAPNKGSSEVINLTFAHGLDTENPAHLGAVFFADKLKELSGGTMVTTVHPNSALGDDGEVVEIQASSDSVTFSIPSGYCLQNYTPAAYAVDFYFQFNDYDQVWKFYDGEYGDYIKKSLDGTGLVVTTFWDNGFRNLTTTKKAVHTPEDLKGMKIRVMNAETHLAAWNALGAAATPIAYAEVYSALQQGVVDGQENPLANIYGSRFQEVQHYVHMDRHVHDPAPFIISEKAWKSWTPEQQGWVLQASLEAGAYARQLSEDKEGEYLDKLVDAGMEVVNLTDAEFDQFKEAVSVVPGQFADRMGDAYDVYLKCIDAIN